MEKISIKYKSDLKIKKNKTTEDKSKTKKIECCPICEQHMDLCVTSHKNKPFVDNKLYPKICFTCYSVPKILDQKYDENGYIKEEIHLEYNRKNLNNPEQILAEGGAETIQQAKKCYKAVKNLKIEKEIKNKSKPKLEFYIND